MSVHGENVSKLFGVEVHLQFDPTVLEVVDADPVPGVFRSAWGRSSALTSLL